MHRHSGAHGDKRQQIAQELPLETDAALSWPSYPQYRQYPTLDLSKTWAGLTGPSRPKNGPKTGPTPTSCSQCLYFLFPVFQHHAEDITRARVMGLSRRCPATTRRPTSDSDEMKRCTPGIRPCVNKSQTVTDAEEVFPVATGTCLYTEVFLHACAGLSALPSSPLYIKHESQCKRYLVDRRDARTRVIKTALSRKDVIKKHPFFYKIFELLVIEL